MLRSCCLRQCRDFAERSNCCLPDQDMQAHVTWRKRAGNSWVVLIWRACPRQRRQCLAPSYAHHNTNNAPSTPRSLTPCNTHLVALISNRSDRCISSPYTPYFVDRHDAHPPIQDMVLDNVHNTPHHNLAAAMRLAWRHHISDHQDQGDSEALRYWRSLCTLCPYCNTHLLDAHLHEPQRPAGDTEAVCSGRRRRSGEDGTQDDRKAA
jgi:hypothetical protein